MSKRSVLTTLGVALASVALVGSTAGVAQAEPRGDRWPERIALPTGFQPEGITISKSGTAYLGSRGDGDIYAADLRTGKGAVISQGPGTGSIGLKLDEKTDVLYVAGGAAGTARVVRVRDGKLLTTLTLATGVSPTTPSFVNDVVLTGRYAWFTDSRRAQLYRVDQTRRGVPDQDSVKVLPLTGDWVQPAPTVTAANGITQTPDGRALLVVASNTGELFRVDPKTGEASEVDLGGTLLTNGDGLLLRGRTLYAVQNRLNQVAVVKLNRDGTRGRLVETLTSADLRSPATFDVPTTVAAYRGSLYLPNARFGTEPQNAIDFWISRLRP